MNHKHDSVKWIFYWIIFSNSLHPIFIVQGDDALSKSPLIGLHTKTEFKLPKCLKQISPTKLKYYLPEEKSKTVYFCPKSPASFSLYPGKKKECEFDPTPRLRRTTDEESARTECPNIKDIRTLYTYGYQVKYSDNSQEIENEDDWDEWKNIYTFCFHHVEGRIIYFNYQISSPNLLPNDLLKHEREYLEKKYRIKNFNDEAILQYMTKISQRYTEYDRKLPERHQAMIMTPYDMVFAVWKKPFMHLINYAIFSNTFITSQWAKIGIFIRKLAVEGWGELHIKVGTFHHNIGNLHRIWWKLVITQDEVHAIAIIVHDYSLINESPHTDFKCVTSCEQFGFGEIMSPPFLSHLIFCCDPAVITDRVEGLKSYRLFNVTDTDAILKPLPVECDPESQPTN